MTLSLTDLIAKSKLAVELTEAAKKAKASAKKAKSPQAAAEALEQAQEIQARIDWRSQTLVFRLIRWECACGHSGTRPDGLFIFQEHARMANSYRFIRPVEGGSIDLPRRVQTLTEIVSLCIACSSDSEFRLPFVEPPRRLPPSPAREGLGPYVQEFRHLTTPILEENDDGE
jgi:hypothetical protein